MKARTQAEILRAAQLFSDAIESKAAMEDRETITTLSAAIANYEVLRWAAGEDNTFSALLELIDAARAKVVG
jgi:hypothetical protein